MRLEQLYPLERRAPAGARAATATGTPLVWVQEEPRNMGAWYFLNARRREIFGDKNPLSRGLARREREPGDGQQGGHDLEQRMLLEEAFR